MNKKIVVGNAIGKIILMGEHAVVYGEPAIAIPFPAAKVKTTIYRTSGHVSIDCFYHKELLSDAPEIIFGLKEVIKNITNSFNEELENFSLNIESTIPPERGMGSSAAVAIATIRALYNFFDRPLIYDDLLKWANVSEKIVHGNPSGIDAAIVAGEKALYYVKGQPFVPFEFNLGGYLVVGDSGRQGHTKEAVESVRQLVERNEDAKALIKDLGILAIASKKSMETNDPKKLGQLMTKAHSILDILGVSDHKLNQLVSLAMDSGALGAKLTGGGRGGCMIALTLNREEALNISDKLLSGGAKNTWISSLGDDLIEE